jgi:hypothetical protein
MDCFRRQQHRHIRHLGRQFALAAVAALGNGRSAEAIGCYGSWASIDLRALQGALRAKNSPAKLLIAGERVGPGREVGRLPPADSLGVLPAASYCPPGARGFGLK